MKTLAIYGDSYTDPRVSDINSQWISDKAWVNLLKNEYDVTLYGKGGSSIYYSYRHFKNTHHNYDKVIFLTTSFDRWPVDIKFRNYSATITNITTVYHLIKDLKIHDIPTQVNIRPKLIALRNFYQHLYDEEIEAAMHSWCELMVNDVKQTRPDTIFVSYYTMGEYLTAFHENILNFPAEILKLGSLYYNYGDFRTSCHFSEEINQIVYQDATSALNTGKWEVNIPDKIPHSHSFDYYFKRR